ncbi:MAG: hypothetical protein CVU56_01860 [Deltaproteobacteria bacterium HGW-Deltaproteobacteria-14]|nr:MAG: hypothetical protein CVU56_01860 [Deltaproteobacteria bacterium HGW-Deltaproteobacteria-14]
MACVNASSSLPSPLTVASTGPSFRPESLRAAGVRVGGVTASRVGGATTSSSSPSPSPSPSSSGSASRPARTSGATQ